MIRVCVPRNAAGGQALDAKNGVMMLKTIVLKMELSEPPYSLSLS